MKTRTEIKQSLEFNIYGLTRVGLLLKGIERADLIPSIEKIVKEIRDVQEKLKG